jgi:photosystem II stability/assembly factor-like uncharacterized protein
MPARLIGPAGMSGRIASVDVDLTDRSRIIVGTASGGVWRSVDGGVTWHPIFDDQNYLSIGDARISPANPDLIWVGTGEGNPRQSVSIGNGVYLSQDRGASWTHLGLENSERIHRVIPHPTNADIAYVASMGPLWNGGGERGVYRTRDRGRSWEQVLSVNDFTGAAELVMDPRNPDKLVAAMYEHRRYPWNLESGGVGSGIHITHDGGESWTKLGPEHGVPAGPLGRIGLAISASSPNVMYALIEATPSVLLRSDDGGHNWRVISDEPGISPRPMYYADIRVDPKNENRIYRLGNNLDMSEDGGRTWRSLVPTNFIHGDHHALWIDPDDPRILVNGNDGGIGLSYDRGDKWRFVENLPLAQFYKITVDMAVPFNVYGGVQDSGSWMGPSTVWDDRGIVNAHWRRVNGADGFATMVDFSNPRFAYTTSQNGNLLRFDKVTMERRSIRPPAPAGTELRWNWNSPLAVDAHDSTTIYFGSQHVHRSRDGGRTWEAISPDLTTNDAGKQEPTAVGAPPAMEYDNHTTLLAIDQSPVDAGVIWATSDDGKVQVTRDGGSTWTDTGARLPGAPDSAYVPAVKASRHAAGRAYVVVDDHRRGDMRPYIYRTEDHGGRWEALSTNGLEGFLHAVEEDPVEPNLLFAGSELGLFVSLDRGRSWMKWTHGVPAVPIRGIVVHPRDHDLVIGTHGRAIWIVDDIRPLRALAADASIRERALHAFEAPPAQQHEVAMQGDAGILLGYRVVGHAMFFGESRPYGALLSYWVGPQAAGGRAQIQVRSADGRVIRDLEGSATNGINRVVWDLREPAPTPAAGGGGGGRGGQGAEVAPGTYQVTIRLGGQESTTTVQVLPDPRKQGVEFFITR